MLEAARIAPEDLLLAQANGAAPPTVAPVVPAVVAQVPGGPAVGPSGVLPYTSTTTTGASTTSHSSNSEDIRTPEIAKAEAGVAQAAADKKAAIAAETGANVAREAISAQGADAEVEARAQAERERAALQQRTNELTASALAAQKQAREELKAAGPKSYIEDMGPFRRVLAALSLGAGAYGSAMTGGPNHAFAIFQANEADWRKKQEAILAQKVRNVETATGDVKQAQEMLVTGMAQIQNRELARLDFLRSKMTAQIKRVPAAAVEGQKAIAAIDQEEQKLALAQANLFKRHHESGVTRSSGNTSVTEVSGQKGGTPTGESALAFVGSEDTSKLLGEFRQIVKKHPAAWDAFKGAMKDFDETQVGKEQRWGGFIGMGQYVGAIPIGVDQRLNSIEDAKTREAARRINQLFPIIQTGQARILDDKGPLNEAAHVQARKTLNLYTMTPAEADKIAAQFQAKAERMATIMGGSQTLRHAEAAGKAAKAAPGPATPPRHAGGGVKMSAEQAADYKAAKAALAKDPKDAKALQLLRLIRESLAKQAAGGAP
jgi:hypothetical protein